MTKSKNKQYKYLEIEKGLVEYSYIIDKTIEW